LEAILEREEDQDETPEGELIPTEVQHAGGRDLDYGNETQAMVPAVAASPAQLEETALAMNAEEDQWERIVRFSQFAAASGLYGEETELDLAMKALVGTALGLSIATSFQALQKIRNGINIPAELQRALVRRAGYRIRQVELTYESCTLQLVVAATGELVGESTYTMDDAGKAKLLGNETWHKYRKNMLFARCTTDLLSRFAPEILYFSYGDPL